MHTSEHYSIKPFRAESTIPHVQSASEHYSINPFWAKLTLLHVQSAYGSKEKESSGGRVNNM